MSKYKLKIGDHKFASPTASFALLRWMSTTVADADDDVVVMYGPYHENFVLAVTETILARFGKVCRVNSDLLKKSWYESGLPEDKYDPEVIQKIGTGKVKEYEEWCEQVLRWLRKNSAITSLKIT